ncbi:hypothetical protein GQ600_1537 [Phytophthora cactorum]|nr:hypothetical protein GQ600_1537 [Phytophthora cactorum]
MRPLTKTRFGDWYLTHHQRRFLQDKAAISAALRGAYRSHRCNILKWLATQFDALPPTDCVDAAVKDGDLEFLKWVHANKLVDLYPCAPSAMRDAVLGHHVPVILFLLKNYQHDICEEGICFLRDEWEDLEVRFVGLTQWLLEQFGGALEGASFSVNRADCDKQMDDRSQRSAFGCGRRIRLLGMRSCISVNGLKLNH